MLTLYKHTLVPDLPGLAEEIGNPETVLDVGAGLRPATWVNAKRHVCMEPCKLYADALREHGYEVTNKWIACDLVLMLDVIEHVTRDYGREMIWRALDSAPRIIIYTPFGFVPQEEDKWGTGQHEWQRHRSGWMPHDFSDWKILRGQEGFAAIYGDVGR